MKNDRVVITGMGIVSAIGNSVEAILSALLCNTSGLTHAHYLSSIHSGEYMLGEVDMSNDALKTRLNIPLEQEGYTRTTLLALLAVQQLAGTIGLDLLRKNDTGLFNANTVGGMSQVELMYRDFLGSELPGSIVEYIDTLDCAESTERIARHLGMSPLMATISTACSSSGNAILLGARMIKQGVVKRAICGGCDAFSRFTLNGFISLKNVDKQPCRPFSHERNGLNLGEGAAYLMLEKESDAMARNAQIYAVLSGYNNTNDAYHPTAPSPDGTAAMRTMQRALALAGLQPEDIGYINAHGTATLNNDSAEGLAIQSLWRENPPPFCSTKPFTGHTLAAAAAIEAIFSILSLRYSFVPANLNFGSKMDELSIMPNLSTITNYNLQHVLSNSFGFGGNNVSLVFSKP